MTTLSFLVSAGDYHAENAVKAPGRHRRLGTEHHRGEDNDRPINDRRTPLEGNVLA